MVARISNLDAKPPFDIATMIYSSIAESVTRAYNAWLKAIIARLSG